jgi:hypothetical protein
MIIDHGGFNADSRGHMGRTALHYLALCYQPGLTVQGRLEATGLLWEKGVDVEVRDMDGKSMADSVSSYDAEMVQLIADLQARLNGQGEHCSEGSREG